jgi:hypothetical protein
MPQARWGGGEGCSAESPCLPFQLRLREWKGMGLGVYAPMPRGHARVSIPACPGVPFSSLPMPTYP